MLREAGALPGKRTEPRHGCHLLLDALDDEGDGTCSTRHIKRDLVHERATDDHRYAEPEGVPVKRPDRVCRDARNHPGRIDPPPVVAGKCKDAGKTGIRSGTLPWYEIVREP